MRLGWIGLGIGLDWLIGWLAGSWFDAKKDSLIKWRSHGEAEIELGTRPALPGLGLNDSLMKNAQQAHTVCKRSTPVTVASMASLRLRQLIGE